MNPFLVADGVKMRKKILCNNNAQSIIELALLLPLILLLALGVFEFGRAIHAKNIVINMSREGANLASRTTEDPQYIMNSLALTAQPLKMSSNGTIYITEVRGKSDGNIEVVKQYKWLSTTYQTSSRVLPTCNPWVNGVCTPPDPRPNADLDALHLDLYDLAEGQIAYAAEIFYDYQVIFGQIIQYSPEMYSMTIF